MVDAVVCVPIASGTMKSPTAAAEPLDEPPGVGGLLVALFVAACFGFSTGWL